jgi:hypothetical protein
MKHTMQQAQASQPTENQSGEATFQVDDFAETYAGELISYPELDSRLATRLEIPHAAHYVGGLLADAKWARFVFDQLRERELISGEMRVVLHATRIGVPELTVTLIEEVLGGLNDTSDHGLTAALMYEDIHQENGPLALEQFRRDTED